MSSFRKRSPPVVAPDAEAMLVVPAQSLCCSRLTENGAATSEKNPQNGNFAGSLLGRAGSRQPYERSVALACHRFFAHRETHVPENPHFGQIRPSRVRAAVLKRRLQRALALQLLAKSNRLRKGGCALKRLSEDFRVCHGRGWLDQGALRHWPMSRAVHLSYRRLTDLSLRRERLRNRGAVAPIDRRPQSMRPDDTQAFAMKSPVDAHDANAGQINGCRRGRGYRIARCVRPADRPAPLGRVFASSHRRSRRASPR
jgi:hypothetical protein